MRIGPILAGMLGRMLVPAAVLAALVWAGTLGWRAALLAGGAVAAGALWGAALAARERARTARALERLSRQMDAGEADAANPLRQADEAIVEGLPDPLILLDRGRAVRRTNEAARLSYGADIRAVLRHPELRAAVDRAFATRTTQTAELKLPVPVLRDVHATVLLLHEPDIAAVLLSDRTRERAVERMRADFVANASHELRTPLTSLAGFVETLRGPAASDPEAQERFLGIMAEQAARMSRLIDDLLSLSRIELTEHQRPYDLVDLGELMAEMTAAFEPQLRDRDATLVLHADALPPVLGDADQLAQVLQNLLDNALKYGRRGGTIRVTGRSDPVDPRLPSRPGVLIAVADEGQGIGREHLPRLTERFYRVDKGRSRAVGGTGLGLAIVKHIVNRHRGQLLIESTEGVGTIVSVWLPAAPNSENSRRSEI